MSRRKRKPRHHGSWSPLVHHDGRRNLWICHVIELDRVFEGSSAPAALAAAGKAIEADEKRPFVALEDRGNVKFVTDSPKLQEELEEVIAKAKEAHRGC